MLTEINLTQQLYQSRVRNQYPIPLATDERKEIRVWVMDLGAY